jgi:hypothetical protein
MCFRLHLKPTSTQACKFHINLHPPYLLTSYRNRHIPVNYAALQAECGNLGVLAVPEGANPVDVRHCAAHPNGGGGCGVVSVSTSAEIKESGKCDIEIRDVESDCSAAATPEKLFKRDEQCKFSGPPYGCSNHWCWRECKSSYE